MKTIFLTAFALTTLLGMAQCPTVTSISDLQGANGTATLTALCSGSLISTPTAVTWNYYPATYISGNNPVVIQFPANGTYSVCASYSTCPVPAYCTSLTISSYTPPPVAVCQSSFTVFADTANPGNYFAYNTSTGSGLSYLWDFGDGSSSALQYPFHQYTTPGHYVICLTVNSGSVCTSTYCDSSSVHRIASGFAMSQITVVPQAVTGIHETDILTGLMVYPNPMQNEVMIKLNKIEQELHYMLTDAAGRLVLSSKIEGTETVLHTSDLKGGFYMLTILNSHGDKIKTLKMIK